MTGMPKIVMPDFQNWQFAFRYYGIYMTEVIFNIFYLDFF